MVKKKYYAVKQGRQTGIYESWAQCKTQIDGFSGAIYKSFFLRSEAECYLSGAESQQQEISPAEAVAYVDGSYHHGTEEFSYGVVLFHQGKEEHYFEKFTASPIRDMRNVAGEIRGAQKAMQLCLEKGIKSLALYHDYEGIARWCTGEWQAKKEGTKAYKLFYDQIKDQVQVCFIKVKGHSGDPYNEIADQLAKKALGL